MNKRLSIAMLMLIVSAGVGNANEPTLDEIAGKTCWGPFHTPMPVGDKDLGAVYIKFSDKAPIVGEFWRAWGRPSHDSPRELPDKNYDSIGQTSPLEISAGAIRFKTPTGFTWELTPISDGGSYTTKITGGQKGATGTLTCTVAK